MILQTLSRAMSASKYPGRGIVLGLTPDGDAAIAYFIMGRSENSRNRVFAKEGDGLRTQAFDPKKLADPSLIIYAPVRVLGSATIVTNGDQTDTIYDFLARGEGFEAALRTREFEPDEPNWTPRVSGIVVREKGAFSYKLAILKSADGNPADCRRFFYEYQKPVGGEGHFLHTYAGDGKPLPSFEGEPERVAVPGGIDEFTDEIWNHLDPENRVSLFTRFICAKTGETTDRIVNQNKREA